MKKFVSIIFVIGALFCIVSADQNRNGLKVFISVDMEGISGVINWEDVNRDGKDYGLFRKLMTEETNAAIEGALALSRNEYKKRVPV